MRLRTQVQMPSRLLALLVAGLLLATTVAAQPASPTPGPPGSEVAEASATPSATGMSVHDHASLRARRAKHKNGEVVRERPPADERVTPMDREKRAAARRQLEEFVNIGRRPVRFPTTTRSESLRLMTYNVCAFPEPAQANFTKTLVCDGRILGLHAKAAKIAEGIRLAAPDIVVINEAWDEAFRLDLAREMIAAYPNAVLTIDGMPPKVEDSGLMIFSKLPFAPLKAECQEPGSAMVLATPPNGPKSVCATIFDSGEGTDAYSSKGVGLAKFSLGGTAHVYVAFTHLQADDGESATRREQLVRIQELIEHCGPAPTERSSSAVFLAGDLNVPGRLSVWEGTVTAEPQWRQLFQEAGRIEYFAAGEPTGTPERFLADSYRYYGSPDGQGLTSFDPGATQGIAYSESATTIAAPCGADIECSGQRYDYVFQGPYRPYRLERVRVAWEVDPPTAAGGRCNLSDHQPVIADYHTYFAPNQSVRTAKPIVFGDADEVRSASGTLPSPRAMLWYRLEAPAGLYGIVTSSQVARLEVFAQNDLSRPMAPYPGSTGERIGPKYYLPDPPYFIRVFPREGQQSGAFNLRVTRVDCSSPEASCPLLAGVTGTFNWPTTLVNGATVWGDEMWFSFLTAESNRHEAPSLEFEFRPAVGVCPDDSTCNYTLHSNSTGWLLELLPSPSATPPAAWVDDMRLYGDSMVFATSPLPGGANGALREYLLRITRKRDIPAGANTQLTLDYRTPLSYLFIGALNCSEEWQGFGDPVFDPSMLPAAAGNDDVFAQFVVDPKEGHENMPQTPPTVVPAGWTYWGSFYEETDPAQWPGPNGLWFLRSVRVDLVEWDPPLPEGNANDPYSPTGLGEFLALPVDGVDQSPMIVWQTDDYNYQLKYSRVTRLPLECQGMDIDADNDGYPDACRVERVPLGN